MIASVAIKVTKNAIAIYLPSQVFGVEVKPDEWVIGSDLGFNNGFCFVNSFYHILKKKARGCK